MSASPVSAPDLSDWLLKREVAERLGCSTRTVETYGATGRLHQAKRKDGKTWVNVFHPGDVERLAAAVGPRPFVLEDEPERVPASEGLTVRPSPPPLAASPLAAFALLMQAAAAHASQGPKPFLTISEAAEYAGLPVTYLRRMVRSKQLAAVRVGRAGWPDGYRIRRMELEAFCAGAQQRTEGGLMDGTPDQP